MSAPSRLLEQLEALDIVYTAFNAERALRATDAELSVRVRFDGALHAIMDPTRPSACAYNRLVGLDERQLGALDGVLAEYEAHDLAPRVDVPPRRLTPRLGAALVARGFVPRGGLTWLVARPGLDGGEPHDPARVTVRRLEDHDVSALFALIGSEELGGPFADDVLRRRRHHYCTPTFRAYVASVDGRDVASATLFVSGRHGVLANAYTQQGHRNVGAQSALYRARLADAAALGLEWVATDVVEGSTSQRNAERAGFRVATHQLWFERPEVADERDEG